MRVKWSQRWSRAACCSSSPGGGIARPYRARRPPVEASTHREIRGLVFGFLRTTETTEIIRYLVEVCDDATLGGPALSRDGCRPGVGRPRRACDPEELETAHATGIRGSPGFVGPGKGEPRRTCRATRSRVWRSSASSAPACHNFKSSGLPGANKPGSDLDDRKPTYDKIVTLIAQGGGGGRVLEGTAPGHHLRPDLRRREVRRDLRRQARPRERRDADAAGAGRPRRSAPRRADSAGSVGTSRRRSRVSTLRWHVHVGSGARPALVSHASCSRGSPGR